MSNIGHIWNVIVTSNTFNFAVMILLLGMIFKKIDIVKILEDAIAKVEASIEKSKAEKQAAKEKLEAANDLIKNLDAEIAAQLKDAEQQGEFLRTNISNDTDNRIANIESSIERIVQSEEKTVSTRLARKTAAAAVSTAENHIRTILKNSPQMHDKYILESINELDRIQI